MKRNAKPHRSTHIPFPSNFVPKSPKPPPSSFSWCACAPRPDWRSAHCCETTSGEGRFAFWTSYLYPPPPPGLKSSVVSVTSFKTLSEERVERETSGERLREEERERERGDMFSDGVGSEPRLQRVLTLFDMEAAAVVAILLGIVQLLLSAPLYYIDTSLPKNLFILPLLIGTLIVAAGSLTMACVKYPSKYLRQGCACSNVACLLGTVLSLCLYCFSLSSVMEVECVEEPEKSHYFTLTLECLEGKFVALFQCVTTLLLCYTVGAMLLHGLLTVTSIRALRSP